MAVARARVAWAAARERVAMLVASAAATSELEVAVRQAAIRESPEGGARGAASAVYAWARACPSPRDDVLPSPRATG